VTLTALVNAKNARNGLMRFESINRLCSFRFKVCDQSIEQTVNRQFLFLRPNETRAASLLQMFLEQPTSITFIHRT
jgi:hypothetical protein